MSSLESGESVNVACQIAITFHSFKLFAFCGCELWIVNDISHRDLNPSYCHCFNFDVFIITFDHSFITIITDFIVWCLWIRQSFCIIQILCNLMCAIFPAHSFFFSLHFQHYLCASGLFFMRPQMSFRAIIIENYGYGFPSAPFFATLFPAV